MTTMPTTLRRSRVRSTRAMRRGALAGAVCTLATFLVVGLLVSGHHTRSGTPHGSTSPAQRVQLAAWASAVHPLILSAGQVVALGPRQGVQQLQSGEFSAIANQHMAAGWVARLTRLRAQVASLHAPSFMTDAQSLLDRSLTGYLSASQDLLAASTATGSRRQSLLDSANAAGRAADRLFDQATAAIAARRALLELPVDWSGSS
jgi:hypothetical protein